MKAVIMAGGKGTRLRPLTCHMPKPMVPLLNRPCMEYIIELLRDHGITQIAVTMQYLPEIIRNHFGDGSDYGVELHYFEETIPLGTAGGVKNAQSFLDERFIVISGDALTDIDLSLAEAYHEEKNALATIIMTRVAHPLEYGVVMTDEEGKIVRFLEKPAWSEVFSDTINTGIYILEPNVLDLFQHGQEYDFSNQLFPSLLQQQKPLYGYASPGYWSDIGNLAQYRQTQFDMLDGRVKLRIKANEVQPKIFVGDNVTVHPNVTWSPPVFIGDNSQLEEVEAGPYCIVGSGNRIARGSTLCRAVIWNNNHVLENNEINGATFGSQIQCFPGSTFADGSVVGSHCTIGTKTVVQPNVKIWPKKQTRENTILHSSLIWGDCAAKALFKTHGVSGMPNVDMTPEFAAQFACAYGTTMAIGQTLTVSSSQEPFARLMKLALVSGLQSVGVSTVDLGQATSPIARFAIRDRSAAGGLHLQCAERNGTPVCDIECFDSAALPIGKSMERKVENAFWQEDYARANLTELGDDGSDPSVQDRYFERLCAELRFTEHKPLRIVALAQGKPLQQLFAKLMYRFGIEYYPVSAKEGLEAIPLRIAETGADFGVALRSDGRRMRLYTEDGTGATKDQLMVLQLLAYFHTHTGQTVGIPLSAPNLLERAAEGLGSTVVRTKQHARAMLEASKEREFHPLYDALYATGLIARNVIHSGMSVGRLLEWLPDFSMHRESIECPWDAKGKIMRSMMEQIGSRQAELLDGIKFYHDDAWVLLLPDANEPVFQLIVHGDRPEDVNHLADQYRQEIMSYLQ